jgi:hypothetical protein
LFHAFKSGDKGSCSESKVTLFNTWEHVADGDFGKVIIVTTAKVFYGEK